MLKELKLSNFTLFPEAHLKFSRGLNVIVGENSTGKSQLLKLAYSVIAASAEEGRKPNAASPTKTLLQKMLAEKLVNVMRAEYLGRLARRTQGRERCEVEAIFGDEALNCAFGFSTPSKSEVAVGKVPTQWQDKAPVFLPTRELLTLYPNFLAVYDNHYLEFEETYRDLCVLLGALALKGAREETVAELVAPLEQVMGGKVVLEKNGRFYLKVPGQGNLEMPLVAEGIRKLAMLARLISTGSLLDKGYLFWDEPESNLNPKLIRLIADFLIRLCEHGMQVFIATHSLFLLREIEIRLASTEGLQVKRRFFGLHRAGGEVSVQQGKSVDDIGDITSLEESLKQSDRYLEADL